MRKRPPGEPIAEATALDAGAVRRRSLTIYRVMGVAALAALTAVGARIAVPVPGLPVPFTFQVVAVLLAGALLGPRLGAASQITYLAAGIAGLPVFAAGGGVAYLLGPTGGYLLAFPLAAAVAGLAFTRSDSLPLQLLGLMLGVALIHAAGAWWLAVLTGQEDLVRTAVLPFVGVDVLKVLLVLVVGRRFAGRATGFFGEGPSAS